MRSKILLLHLLAAVVFVLFYDGFFLLLPFQIVLVLVLLLAIFTDSRFAFFWALILGIFLDSSVALPTGTFLISLILTCFLIIFISRNFLTSRSFYSVLILIPMGTLVFEAFSNLLSSVLFFLKLNAMFIVPDLRYILRLTVYNTLTAGLVFLVIHSLIYRFKMSFLTK